MASRALSRIVAVLRSAPRLERPDVGWLRKSFELMAAMVPLAADVRREVVSIGGVPAERLTPAGTSGGRVIVYLHGGGYLLGSAGTHRELASRVGRAAGAEVVLPEYRLAPEHPFPAAVDDAVLVVRALLEEGLSPARLAIAGDSAGGGLAVAVMLALRDAGLPLPAAAACLSPWFDLESSGASTLANVERDPMLTPSILGFMAAHYLAGADARHPLASPLHAELAGLPPMLIQVGTAELLHDDSTRLAARARDAGVDVTLEPWDDMIHVWHAYTMLPEAHEAVARVGGYLREKLGGG